MKSLILFILFVSPASGIVIHNVGDSQSFSDIHRQQFHNDLDAAGIDHVFVGDVTTTLRHNSYGGAQLSAMLDGRIVDRGFGPLLDPGLRQTIPAYRPDVFLVMGGINNLIGDDASSTLTEMQALLDYIETNVVDPVVLVANVPAVLGTFAHRNPEILAYNALLASEISFRQADGVRIALADNFTSIDTSTDLKSDLLHLNDDGLRKVGNNWMPAYRSATAVPEPSGALLLGIACLLIRRSKFGRTSRTY